MIFRVERLGETRLIYESSSREMPGRELGNSKVRNVLRQCCSCAQAPPKSKRNESGSSRWKTTLSSSSEVLVNLFQQNSSNETTEAVERRLKPKSSGTLLNGCSKELLTLLVNSLNRLIQVHGYLRCLIPRLSAV